MIHPTPPFACVLTASLFVGEFARFHPFGKAVVGKLGGKAALMALLSTVEASASVQKQALLAVQKVMLNDWQRVTAASNE